MPSKRSSKRRSTGAGGAGSAAPSLEQQVQLLLARVTSLEEERASEKQHYAEREATLEKEYAAKLAAKEAEFDDKLRANDDRWKVLNQKFIDKLQAVTAPVCVTPPDSLAGKEDPQSPVTPDRDDETIVNPSATSSSAAARALDMAVDANMGTADTNEEKILKDKMHMQTSRVQKDAELTANFTGTEANAQSFVGRLVQQFKKRVAVIIEAVVAFISKIFSGQRQITNPQVCQ